jgi:hypothetical protein
MSDADRNAPGTEAAPSSDKTRRNSRNGDTAGRDGVPRASRETPEKRRRGVEAGDTFDGPPSIPSSSHSRRAAHDFNILASGSDRTRGSRRTEDVKRGAPHAADNSVGGRLELAGLSEGSLGSLASRRMNDRAMQQLSGTEGTDHLGAQRDKAVPPRHDDKPWVGSFDARATAWEQLRNPRHRSAPPIDYIARALEREQKDKDKLDLGGGESAPGLDLPKTGRGGLHGFERRPFARDVPRDATGEDKWKLNREAINQYKARMAETLRKMGAKHIPDQYR